MSNEHAENAIDRLDVACYRVPTDRPESDGTLKWDHTDMVMVHAHAGDWAGVGWSYAGRAAGAFVADILRPVVLGRSALAIEGIWQEMNHHLRNAGSPGAGMMAVSAVDIALWDLKAKLLEVPLFQLFGPVRAAAPLYGSGGFTSYNDRELSEQLSGWVGAGIARVKMKIGREPGDDPRRVQVARKAIGEEAKLFVDANGAYGVKEALLLAHRLATESNITWFEEPRPSDDLAGLHLLRNRAPAAVDIAAGEYGDTPDYFRRMLEARAVDCLQADLTRCGGYTGFLKVGALCEAFHVPLSAHCAPQLHAAVACAAQPLRHVEYFHDHVRIAQMLFDGVLVPEKGALRPDPSRHGHGLALKTPDAARYLI